MTISLGGFKVTDLGGVNNPSFFWIHRIVSVIRKFDRRSLFLSQKFNKKKLIKFGGIKEKMLYLYIINHKHKNTLIMENLITLYTDIFNSLDTIQKSVFIFWTICVVLFFSSFTLLVFHTIRQGIVNMFKRTPRPQRF